MLSVINEISELLVQFIMNLLVVGFSLILAARVEKYLTQDIHKTRVLLYNGLFDLTCNSVGVYDMLKVLPWAGKECTHLRFEEGDCVCVSHNKLYLRSSNDRVQCCPSNSVDCRWLDRRIFTTPRHVDFCQG